MMVFIKNFVAECAPCQQMKVNTHPTTLPIMWIKSLGTHHLPLVTTNFVTDLPESDRSDALMVVVDHGSTKGAIFIACNKTITATGPAQLYFKKVYSRFGLPDKMISDRDPHFTSNLFQELGRLLGIKLAMSTAYHPQTNGKTEHVNQEVEIYLRMFCSNQPEAWKKLLPTAKFSHNQRTHSTLKHSPFYLMMGYEPMAIPVTYLKTKVPEAE
jgi:hypothetical protein